ncbi:hypothetical protein CICLE_v10002862mg [Citrus x clementina]|uniref:Uncharacterized protein n=1 Tax=Citrus clementina TaxID=85681 RepID=V4T690_CITCL|nr:hypothetical protein CICLE_v10002862mg [Citrus x clementina]
MAKKLPRHKTGTTQQHIRIPICPYNKSQQLIQSVTAPFYLILSTPFFLTLPAICSLILAGSVLPHSLGSVRAHSRWLRSPSLSQLRSPSLSRSQLHHSLSPNTIGLTRLVKVSVQFIALICN